MRDGAAPRDAGPGAPHLRGEAGLRPEHHEAGAGPLRRDGTGADGDEGCALTGEAGRGAGARGHDNIDSGCTGSVLSADSRGARGGRSADAQYLFSLAGGDESPDYGKDCDV